MLIRAESVTKSFGPVKVLRRADLQINRGDSIGLIGVNGAGKSTFVKILMGEMPPDTGEMQRHTGRIGYLSQFPEGGDSSVSTVLGRPYGALESARQRMLELEAAMASGEDIDWNEITAEYAALEGEVSRSGAEDRRKQVAALEEVGLSEAFMERPMGELSGGERTKVALARVLVQAEDCDILFLDEPTSHLDVDTVEWLEDYLLRIACAVVVISHDRYFLDKVVTRVVEIEEGFTREYRGNYSSFIKKKMVDIERLEKESQRSRREKTRQERIAEEQHRANPYLSLHKTRRRMAERIDVPEAPHKAQEIRVRIQAADKSGKNVLRAQGLSVSLGGRALLSGVDMDVHKGDKIGIFGANGEGKSTLVKALVGELPCEGELWRAPGAKIVYFSQTHDALDLKLSAEEQLLMALGQERKADARGMLARMLLFGDAVERPLGTLSGGERVRVALALLLLKESNLLVLDEPTNYLDIPSRHAVEMAFNDYGGSMMVVTHDRYLLDTVCNRVAEVKDGGVRIFNGTFSEMRGRRPVEEIVQDADEYRVLSSFTNWATKRRHVQGDRVLIAPAELKSFQWALDNNKLKRTGGRQRKKVRVSDERKEEQ